MPTYNGEWMSEFDYAILCETNYTAAKLAAAEAERYYGEPPMPPESTAVDYTNGEGGNATPLTAALTLIFVVGAMALVMAASVML